MKKILSLLVAGFMEISLMGQEAIRNLPQSEIHLGMEVLEGIKRRELKTDDFKIESRAQAPIIFQLAQAVSQQLDSIIWESLDVNANEFMLSQKVLYTYNAEGKIIQDLFYIWLENINQMAAFKGEYIYGSNGKQMQSYSYRWDSATSQWIKNGKSESTYDSNGRIIQRIEYDLVNTSQLEFDSKWEFSYGSSGSITERIIYQWNSDASQWVGSEKVEISYDTKGLEVLSIIYKMDPKLSQWFVSWKNETAYNENGQITQFLQADWDTINRKWDRSLERDYTYNSQGREIQFVSFARGYNNSWIYINKRESIYDLNGNITQCLIYLWSTRYSEWTYHGKVEYIYDSAGNLKQTIESTSDSKMSHYYSKPKVTDITNPPINKLKAYPNPASEYFIFDLEDPLQPASIELIDMQGKKVISQILPISHRIEVSQLKGGMYFYTIIQNKDIYKGKVIVK